MYVTSVCQVTHEIILWQNGSIALPLCWGQQFWCSFVLLIYVGGDKIDVTDLNPQLENIHSTEQSNRGLTGVVDGAMRMLTFEDKLLEALKLGKIL